MRRRKSLFIIVICMTLSISVLILCPCAWAKKHHKSGDRYEPDEEIFTNAQDIDATYSDWMTKNKDILKNLPIDHIPLLGSHDAGSCDVNPSSPGD